MTGSVKVSEAIATQYEGIADIYNQYIRAGTATMDEVEKQAHDIEAWVKGFNDRERLFAAHVDGVLIGWAIIKRYSDRGGYRFTCETAVYLDEAHTGRGYGPTIKSFLINQCERLGYRHLVAKIFSTNQASIQYNLKMGYTIVGCQNRVGFKDGKWLDVVIMQFLIE